MKVIKTEFRDLLIIEPDIFPDNRGYFFESHNLKKYFDLGITKNFVQDNISKSVYGTLRGLHFQIGEYAQGKLCQVIYGKVLDIAVDIRIGSPTYGKHFSIELSEGNHRQIYIPEGFAHGFSVLSDIVIFMYKCTSFYNKNYERGILYNDPDLKIDWKIKSPLVSEKDLNHPRFKIIDNYFYY